MASIIEALANAISGKSATGHADPGFERDGIVDVMTKVAGGRLEIAALPHAIQGAIATEGRTLLKFASNTYANVSNALSGALSAQKDTPAEGLAIAAASTNQDAGRSRTG